jgi:hypothetical protein
LISSAFFNNGKTKFQPSPYRKDLAALTDHHTTPEFRNSKHRATNKVALITSSKQKLGGSNPVEESPSMGHEDFHYCCLQCSTGVHNLLGKFLMPLQLRPMV